ncbi:MAG: hypothetical protein HY295_01300 [Thaumarchaeota archaeon]|nr:hypothetical protein [Nitrososphaerota archaeon]
MTLVLFLNTNITFAQQPQLSTFHEIAQIIVDQKILNQTTTTITLSSTSTGEIRVPLELDQKIRDAKNIIAIVITNEDKCALGVTDSICVLINISNEGLDKIEQMQAKGQEVGDSLINDINKAFSLNAKFSSVYVHSESVINKELQTSGVVSGRGTISAVYTMPKSDTSYLYETFTTTLLARQIRDSGGFLDVAKKIADDPNSSVTFSIIPSGEKSIFQLQVNRDYPLKNKITTINPLELLDTQKLERSSYFNVGFFPLNSLVQVVVLSNEVIQVTSHGSELVPTFEKDGEKFPSDLTKNGWFFDPDSGTQIVGRYLFGKTSEVSKADLQLTIGNSTLSETPSTIPLPEVIEKPSTSETTSYNLLYIPIGIGIAIVAATFLLIKKRKKRI